ncbi:hypothetical protein LDENG_00244560 [Lucifuga dentata]|nr:hypothetical protein LDENG_00244560 [Lucifuga dentata]
MEKEWPKAVNLSSIAECKQREEEPVTDFYHRLKVIFDANAGLKDEPPPQPQAPGQEPGLSAYAGHLKVHFMTNMLPHLRQNVMKTCIGVGTASPSVILDHAKHAEDMQREEKKRNDERKEQEKEVYRKTKQQLTMLQLQNTPTSNQGNPQQSRMPASYQTAYQRPRGGYGGRGQGPDRGQRPDQTRGRGRFMPFDPDACRLCRKKDHQTEHCPWQGKCFRCGGSSHWTKDFPQNQTGQAAGD